MEADEIAYIEKFADKYSPDTKGEPLVNRIGDIDNKIKSLFIGAEQLVRKLKQNFPSVIADA